MTWHDLRREPTVHLGRRRRFHLSGSLGVSLCGRTIDPTRAEANPPGHLKCERCQRAYDRHQPPATSTHAAHRHADPRRSAPSVQPRRSRVARQHSPKGHPMTPTPNRLSEGWGWPLAAKKAHYYKEGDAVSLSGRWAYSGPRKEAP